eukprot:gene15360-18173_t
MGVKDVLTVWVAAEEMVAGLEQEMLHADLPQQAQGPARDPSNWRTRGAGCGGEGEGQWAWNPDCSTLQDLVELPRSQVAVLGGDLAYPNPSYESYESRLFRPFEDAFPPPPWYSSAYVAVNKPDLPPGMDSLKSYSGPQCFAIP